jgi:hypothetical protein
MNRIELASLVTVRLPFLRTNRGQRYTEGMVGIVEEVREYTEADQKARTMAGRKVRAGISYRVTWEGPNGALVTRWMRASHIKAL